MTTFAVLAAFTLALHTAGSAIDGPAGVTITVLEAGEVVSRWQMQPSQNPALYTFHHSSGARINIQRLITPDRVYAVTRSPSEHSVTVSHALTVVVPARHAAGEIALRDLILPDPGDDGGAESAADGGSVRLRQDTNEISVFIPDESSTVILRYH
jgi:hypothetical protein